MGINITSDNFEREVIQSDKLVLVECHAEWCQPCKMLQPLLAELAEANSAIKLVLMDVEENVALSTQFKISAIPKVLVFKDGLCLEEMVGVQSRQNYQDVIDRLS